jgi:hypothetical protein
MAEPTALNAWGEKPNESLPNAEKDIGQTLNFY